MDKVSASKPRSLLYCIARFGDREKLDFVIQHLSRSEDFAGGAALAALTVLDPKAAIDRLAEVPDSERYMSRNNWLPALLRAQPEMTRQRILKLAESDPKGRRHIEMLFGNGRMIWTRRCFASFFACLREICARTWTMPIEEIRSGLFFNGFTGAYRPSEALAILRSRRPAAS